MGQHSVCMNYNNNISDNIIIRNTYITSNNSKNNNNNRNDMNDDDEQTKRLLLRWIKHWDNIRVCMKKKVMRKRIILGIIVIPIFIA